MNQSYRQVVTNAALEDLDEELYRKGLIIGDLQITHGLPIEISVVELCKKGYSKDQIIAILNGAFHQLVMHKRKSGASVESINKQRKSIRKAMDNFINDREIGIV